MTKTSHVTEDIVHEVLKGGGRVSHTKGHHQILKGTIARVEHCLPLMPRRYAHIVVTSTQVNLGNDLCSAQVVHEVTDERERLVVLVHDVVQVAVVNAEVQRAILLLNKQDRHAGQGVGGMNKTLSKKIVQLLA